MFLFQSATNSHYSHQHPSPTHRQSGLNQSHHPGQKSESLAMFNHNSSHYRAPSLIFSPSTLQQNIENMRSLASTLSKPQTTFSSYCPHTTTTTTSPSTAGGVGQILQAPISRGSLLPPSSNNSKHSKRKISTTTMSKEETHQKVGNHQEFINCTPTSTSTPHDDPEGKLSRSASSLSFYKNFSACSRPKEWDSYENAHFFTNSTISNLYLLRRLTRSDPTNLNAKATTVHPHTNDHKMAAHRNSEELDPQMMIRTTTEENTPFQSSIKINSPYANIHPKMRPSLVSSILTNTNLLNNRPDDENDSRRKDSMFHTTTNGSHNFESKRTSNPRVSLSESVITTNRANKETCSKPSSSNEGSENGTHSKTPRNSLESFKNLSRASKAEIHQDLQHQQEEENQQLRKLSYSNEERRQSMIESLRNDRKYSNQIIPGSGSGHHHDEKPIFSSNLNYKSPSVLTVSTKSTDVRDHQISPKKKPSTIYTNLSNYANLRKGTLIREDTPYFYHRESAADASERRKDSIHEDAPLGHIGTASHHSETKKYSLSSDRFDEALPYIIYSETKTRQSPCKSIHSQPHPILNRHHHHHRHSNATTNSTMSNKGSKRHVSIPNLNSPHNFSLKEANLHKDHDHDHYMSSNTRRNEPIPTGLSRRPTLLKDRKKSFVPSNLLRGREEDVGKEDDEEEDGHQFESTPLPHEHKNDGDDGDDRVVVKMSPLHLLRHRESDLTIHDGSGFITSSLPYSSGRGDKNKNKVPPRPSVSISIPASKKSIISTYSPGHGQHENKREEDVEEGAFGSSRRSKSKSFSLPRGALSSSDLFLEENKSKDNISNNKNNKSKVNIKQENLTNTLDSRKKAHVRNQSLSMGLFMDMYHVVPN